MWRSGYDMPPAEFAKLTEKIWQDMKPLYVALHTYVRWKLNEKYGDAVQPKTGPIRADLLGNMWAQEWGNIYPLVAPAGTGDLGRSEERRVGREWVSTCRSRGSRYHKKNKRRTTQK